MAIREPKTSLHMFGPLPEGSSGVYRAIIVDENGRPVPVVNSIKATLYDISSSTIINRRKEQDVNNINGGTLDINTGQFVLQLTPQDNVVLDQRRDFEDHVLRLEFTYNSQLPGASQLFGTHGIIIRVQSLSISSIP